MRREFIGRPVDIKKIFTSTATDLGRVKDFQGHGLVDLMRANQRFELVRPLLWWGEDAHGLRPIGSTQKNRLPQYGTVAVTTSLPWVLGGAMTTERDHRQARLSPEPSAASRYQETLAPGRSCTKDNTEP